MNKRMMELQDLARTLQAEYGFLALRQEMDDERRKEIKKELAKGEAEFNALRQQPQEVPAEEPKTAAADAAVPQ